MNYNFVVHNNIVYVCEYNEIFLEYDQGKNSTAKLFQSETLPKDAENVYLLMDNKTYKVKIVSQKSRINASDIFFISEMKEADDIHSLFENEIKSLTGITKYDL